MDEAASVMEKLSIKDSATAPAEKPATVTKATTKAPAKKAPAKKAAPKKAAPKKKAYDSDEDSDDFMGDSDSDIEIVEAPPARNRSARAAAKPKTYVLDDSSDDGFDEDSECEFD